MKRLLICLTVAAVATITSLQAGESNKEKSTCSADAKTACSAEAKTACSADAKTACSAKTDAKACCSSGKVAKKRVDMSVKGATLLVRR